MEFHRLETMSTNKECGMQRRLYVEPHSSVKTWFQETIESHNAEMSTRGDYDNVTAQTIDMDGPKRSFRGVGEWIKPRQCK